MAPGARSKFVASIFEPDIVRKQMYCIDKSTCDIVGAFRRPHGDSAPGELCPLFPLITSLVLAFAQSFIGSVCWVNGFITVSVVSKNFLVTLGVVSRYFIYFSSVIESTYSGLIRFIARLVSVTWPFDLSVVWAGSVTHWLLVVCV